MSMIYPPHLCSHCNLPFCSDAPKALVSQKVNLSLTKNYGCLCSGCIVCLLCDPLFPLLLLFLNFYSFYSLLVTQNYNWFEPCSMFTVFPAYFLCVYASTIVIKIFFCCMFFLMYMKRFRHKMPFV